MSHGKRPPTNEEEGSFRSTSCDTWMTMEVKKMKDDKFILFVQTSDNPERQYSPLVLAQTAKAMGLRPKLYYLGQGLRILLPGAAEKIKLGTFPTVAEMLQKTMQAGIEIDVCEASKQMLGWEKVNLIKGVKIVGAATLNDLALEAAATEWF
jgi:predicted peroxiredoxin